MLTRDPLFASSKAGVQHNKIDLMVSTKNEGSRNESTLGFEQTEKRLPADLKEMPVETTYRLNGF